MSKKQNQQKHDEFDSIQESFTRGEQFIEKNRSLLTFGVIGILVIAAAVLGYKRWIQAPKEENAIRSAYVAQQYFEKDSFSLALKGDGEFPGFLDVIEDYGSTNIGNLSNYYAGVSYYKLGMFDEAITYMSQFSTSVPQMKSVSLGLIGDAYTEKADPAKAAEYYQKAADVANDELTAPIFLMKLGRTYEKTNQWNKALVAYERIETDYAKTEEGRNITKFITRAKLNIK